MADRSAEERLAAHLTKGVEALRQQRPDTAVLHLRPVADDHELAAAPDLADVRARALTLLAQALLDLDEPSHHDEVERRLDEAQRIDPGPVDPEVRGLTERLADARRIAMEASAREARTKRLAEADIEPLLQRVADPDRRCDLLVQKAQAELTVGRIERGRDLAARALAMKDEITLRPRVMALLTMARASPDDAARYLHEALALADTASAHTLVGTIARTAELLSVPLPTQHGPTTGSRS